MTVWASLLAFTLAAAVLTITPGLDTALVLHTSVAGGARAAWSAALGIALGCLAWGLFAALGLSAILLTSATLFAVLKLAGAGYLLWLGIGLLRAPHRSVAPGAAADLANPFRRGLLTNLLNPKVGLFYVALLPQFVPAGAPMLTMTLAMTAIHAVLGLAWFALLIAATRRIEGWFNRPGAIGWLNRVTGGLFVGLGIKLALESR